MTGPAVSDCLRDVFPLSHTFPLIIPPLTPSLTHRMSRHHPAHPPSHTRSPRSSSP